MNEANAEGTLRTEPRAEDVAAVKRLVASTGFFKPDEIEVAGELVEERLRQGPPSGYFFCFLDLGGQLAAYAAYGPIPGTTASVDLYWIAVDAALQGLGHGRRVLEATERAIEASGRTRIYAETSGQPRYEPTRRFYLRAGYVQEAYLEDFYAPGDDKLFFVKVLGQEPSRSLGIFSASRSSRPWGRRPGRGSS